MINAKTILVRASELINERGWTQGQTEAENGSVCAMGALQVAWMEMDEASNHHYYVAAQTLRNVLFMQTFNDVVSWNDQKGRTKAEVIEAFNKAIEWKS